MIQRRFRNDQERKSGLEQIKGALQLGMESIAQETVEFLYEENGGIPKDLHLPTMDDVKAELGRFTINKVLCRAAEDHLLRTEDLVSSGGSLSFLCLLRCGSPCQW